MSTSNLAKSTTLCSVLGCSRLTPPPEFDALVSRLCSGLSVRARALLNMASDGMILTNHDHQIRVGILTGKYEMTLALFTPRRSRWSVRTCRWPLLIVVPVVIPIYRSRSSTHLQKAVRLFIYIFWCSFIHVCDNASGSMRSAFGLSCSTAQCQDNSLCDELFIACTQDIQIT